MQTSSCASGTHAFRVAQAPLRVAVWRGKATGANRAETSAFEGPCPGPVGRRSNPEVGHSGTARGAPGMCGVLARQQQALADLGTKRSQDVPTPHHVHHIPLSFTPELGGSHTAFFAPCSSAVECHGCYRLMGPANITKSSTGNHMEAHLEEGATLELFHADGNIIISRDALRQLDERYVCICIGHNLEISGQYQVSRITPPGADALAHLHYLHVHDGKLVVSVDGLPLGTTIELAPGAVLMHPVTVRPHLHS